MAIVMLCQLSKSLLDNFLVRGIILPIALLSPLVIQLYPWLYLVCFLFIFLVCFFSFLNFESDKRPYLLLLLACITFSLLLLLRGVSLDASTSYFLNVLSYSVLLVYLLLLPGALAFLSGFLKFIVPISIFLALYLIFAYFFSISYQGRINSLGYFLGANLYPDAHWFSFYAGLIFSTCMVYLLLKGVKFSWIFQVIFICLLVLMGSRSGIFIYLVSQILLLRIDTKKLIILPILLSLFVTFVLLNDLNIRALSIDVNSDSFRIELWLIALDHMSSDLLSLFFGSPDSYLNGKRFYDSLFFQIMLTSGIFGLVLFCLSLMNFKFRVAMLVISTFILSEFLFLPYLLIPFGFLIISMDYRLRVIN